MTDYYPLIARAIAGLDGDAPGESRRALYERARALLIQQMRHADPPVSRSEITSEQLSLEEAIKRVEVEIVASGNSSHHEDDPLILAQAEANARIEADPLAELARLIGQTDPFAGIGRANLPLQPHAKSVDRNASYDSYEAPAEPEEARPPAPPSWMQRAVRHEAPPPAAEDEYPSAVHPLHRYAAPRQSDEVGHQEGLEEAPSPDSKARPNSSLPPLFTLPEQDEKKAIAFRPSRRGPLELLPDSETDFLDPEQAQLYGRMRAQLMKLREDVPGQERTQIDDVINDFLDQPANWQAVEFKKVLWLCGNALRNKLAQHDAVKDDQDPHYNRLPTGVAAALRKPVETWNVFVLGDAELVELDSKRLGPQEQKTTVENINAAKPIVGPAATDRHITTERTGRVLAATLRAASSQIDNINTKQAQYLAEGTSRNLVVQIVRRAYLFCQTIIDPQTDEARALVLEYKKGIVKAAGTATFGAAIYYGAPYASSFFEFVARNAETLKAYVAIALQNDQLRQVIDVIEYTKLSLNEKPFDDAAN
jgi:hypothetical protein